MKRVAAQLDQQYPRFSPGRTVRVIPLQEHLVGKVRPWMVMLLAAVGMLLLIACANVANLMLARSTVRAREVNVRAALGASRWRLVRGLMTEALPLSATGAAIGVALAAPGVRVLRLWLPAGLPRVASIGIDLRVLVAAIGASVARAVLFGLLPAVQASRPDLRAALNDDGRSNTAGRSRQRVRSVLLVIAWYLAAGVKRILFGVEPTDWRVMPVAVGAIVVTTLLAAVPSARKAASIDPLVAMRE